MAFIELDEEEFILPDDKEECEWQLPSLEVLFEFPDDPREYKHDVVPALQEVKKRKQMRKKRKQEAKIRKRNDIIYYYVNRELIYQYMENARRREVEEIIRNRDAKKK